MAKRFTDVRQLFDCPYDWVSRVMFRTGHWSQPLLVHVPTKVRME